MKKQIALVLTLAAFLISACDDENPPRPLPTYPAWTTPTYQPNTNPAPEINSFYPNAGPSGSTMTIIGENFGPAILDNSVTFGSCYAEVTFVSSGLLNVRVPNLADGDYEINVITAGQLGRASERFTITSSQY